jgi:hypothetical protein
MKKETKKLVIQERISKGAIEICENVLFTDLVSKDVLSTPILIYSDFLDLISLDNKLKCRFYKNVVIGKIDDIRKAQNILINSIKYN